ANINPMLGSVVTAAAPVNLHLNQENSAVPLDEFDWRRVAMSGGLDAMDVTLAPGSFTREIFSVLRLAGMRELSSSEVASVSPVAFTIADGRLAYDQPMRITLGGGMVFVFTGGADLATRELDLRMGFAGDRFAQYRLTNIALPIGGTISEPSFDEDRLVQALAEGAGRGLLQEGLGQIFGRPRDQEEQQQDQQQQQEEEQPSEDERERERSPLEELRDLFE
ncbi:MAG: hypothetical protein ACODAQ_05785, partial [Phycisphaeraceae bacterium]